MNSSRTMLKAAIYDPYLDTLGGGERYCLSVVEFLLNNGYQVDIFWSGNQDILSHAQSRFGLEVESAHLIPDIFNEHPHQIECVENQKVIANIISHPYSHLGLFQKIKSFAKRYSITHNYDVFFYISDWSIPYLFSKNNLLHIQLPLAKQIPAKQRFTNYLKLLNFNKIVCNSNFTKNVVQPRLGNKSMVIYPPVDTKQFSPTVPKENIILSVGRFDILFNSKRQDTLIAAFKKMYLQKNLSGWKLVLAGGVLNNIEHNTYLSHLKNLAQDLPVVFEINPDFSTLKNIYETSKIYWHAAGFEVDAKTHPENTEHFGIAPVEAMASGSVPVVVNQGGLNEIVTNNVDGFLWDTTDELVAKTNLLITSPALLLEMSQKAVFTAAKFSKEAFNDSLSKIISI